ncbi:MAG: hypothetical protein H3C47_13235 [Candidatus Cloacimonetes bacterium]|nr:hypothetical protein [Candidatus Cloacimonadota bacterium]
MFRITCILITVLLSGCGGGGGGGGTSSGSSVPNPPPAVAVPPTSVVTNGTLIGTYNALSVRYSQTNSSANQVFGNDVVYTEDSFNTGSENFFSGSELNLAGYSFVDGKSLGAANASSLSNTINGVQVATAVDGLLAAYSFPGVNVNSEEVFGVHIKRGYPQASLSLTHMPLLTGPFGMISLSLDGEVQIGEFTFSSDSGQTTGTAVGKGFVSTSGVAFQTGSQDFVDENFRIVSGNFRILNSDWPWFHTENFSINMTGRSTAVGLGNAFTFLIKPSDNTLPLDRGLFHVFQWTAMASSTAVTGTTATTLPNVDVVRVGTINFANNTSVFQGVLDTVNNKYQFSKVDTSDPLNTFRYMMQFEQIQAINEQRHRLRFFMTQNQNYLFGVDHDGSEDGRVSLFIGIREAKQ